MDDVALYFVYHARNLLGVVLKMPAEGEPGSMLEICEALVGVVPPYPFMLLPYEPPLEEWGVDAFEQ